MPLPRYLRRFVLNDARPLEWLTDDNTPCDVCFNLTRKFIKGREGASHKDSAAKGSRTSKSGSLAGDPSWFEQIDEITDKVDSQTMIEVRLAQRLFERQNIRLALDYDLRAARLVLPD